MRRLLLLPLLALALPMLAACTPFGQAREAYLGQFVGQPELALINGLGVPVDMPPPVSFYSPPYWGISSGFPMQVVQWQCETTVVIRNGIVLNFSFRGNGC